MKLDAEHASECRQLSSSRRKVLTTGRKTPTHILFCDKLCATELGQTIPRAREPVANGDAGADSEGPSALTGSACYGAASTSYGRPFVRIRARSGHTVSGRKRSFVRVAISPADVG